MDGCQRGRSLPAPPCGQVPKRASPARRCWRRRCCRPRRPSTWESPPAGRCWSAPTSTTRVRARTSPAAPTCWRAQRLLRRRLSQCVCCSAGDLASQLVVQSRAQRPSTLLCLPSQGAPASTACSGAWRLTGGGAGRAQRPAWRRCASSRCLAWPGCPSLWAWLSATSAAGALCGRGCTIRPMCPCGGAGAQHRSLRLGFWCPAKWCHVAIGALHPLVRDWAGYLNKDVSAYARAARDVAQRPAHPPVVLLSA